MDKFDTFKRRSGEVAKTKGGQSTSTGGQYQGKYIATKTFNARKVIASGNNPMKVRKEAIKNGAKSPVVVYVPKSSTIYIF